MRYFLGGLFLLFCVACSSLAQNKLLQHDAAELLWIGAVDHQKDHTAFAYSGVQIKFQIKSSKCIIHLKDDSDPEQSNYLYVKVGKQDTTLRLQKMLTAYDVSDLCTGDVFQNVLIHKQTEAQMGKVELYQIELSADAEVEKGEHKKQKIVWIGNSITAGYGNAVSIPAPPKGNPSSGFHSKNQNNYLAWGSIASRELNAEAVQICYSGKGVYRNYDGSDTLTIPQLLKYSLPHEKVNLDAAMVDADFYVIHAGTNDFGYEAKHPKEKVDSLLFTQGMHQIFRQIKQWNPTANIIVVGSNLTTNQYPKNGLKRLQKYLAAAVDAYPKGGLNFHLLNLETQSPPYGENWHPSAQEHQKMAKQVLKLFKTHWNW